MSALYRKYKKRAPPIVGQVRAHAHSCVALCYCSVIYTCLHVIAYVQHRELEAKYHGVR